jgi:hypothetical protein
VDTFTLVVSAGTEVIRSGRNPQAIDDVDNNMELLVYVSRRQF